MGISARGAAIGALLWLHGTPCPAGDLNPPAAPAPTVGPEARIAVSEVNTPGNAEAAFRIRESGSYHLTGNVTLAQGDLRHGIRIEVDNVTLDLNGFTLSGTDLPADSGPGTSLTGIFGSGELANIRVLNGIVQGWGAMGVDLRDVSGGELRGLVAANCGQTGLYLGSGFTVSQCVGRDNGTYGFLGGTASTFTECAAEGNTSHGAFVGAGTSVSNSTFRRNGGSGIITTGPVNISQCTAELNTGSGIRAQGRTRVEGCIASDNTGSGIAILTGNCLIVGNQCYSNGDGDDAGISVESGAFSRIEGNNVTDNSSTGIRVSVNRNIVIGNTAADNATPFDIVPGSATGAVLDVSAGGEITSTNPWRNFAY